MTEDQLYKEEKDKERRNEINELQKDWYLRRLENMKKKLRIKNDFSPE